MTDTLIQRFDESIGLRTSTSPRVCDILRPTPGELTRVDTDRGEGIMVTIRLACEGDRVFRTA